MHLDLTDEQTEAVLESLKFCQKTITAFINRGGGRPEKQAWARQRQEHLAVLIALFPEVAR